MAVVLALGSAVVYGASDFLGGLASRRASVFGVVALSQLAGLAALLALLPWLGGPVTRPTWAGARPPGWRVDRARRVLPRAVPRGDERDRPGHRRHRGRRPGAGRLFGGDRSAAWAAAGILLALLAVVLVSAEGGRRRCGRPGRPA